MCVPFERLHDCAGVLSSHFAKLNIFRMPDEGSVRFRQIAVLSVRRNVRGVAVDDLSHSLRLVEVDIPYESESSNTLVIS